jgi:hypothetical protein
MLTLKKLFRKLPPEEKVNLAVSVTDTCTRICAEGIRDRDESIKENMLSKGLGKNSNFA